MLETKRFLDMTDQLDQAQVRDLLARNETIFLGKLAQERCISASEIFDFQLSRINQFVHAPERRIRLLQQRTTAQIKGLIILERSDWDSEHFGRNIGKVSLSIFDTDVSVKERADSLSKLFAETNFDLISARINLGDLATIQALDGCGGVLMDVLLTLRYDWSQETPAIDRCSFEIEEAVQEDLDKLTGIARRDFTMDRFHGDPRLPRAKSDEVYSKWTANSLHGMANEFLVARDGASIAGFLTCKVEKVSESHGVGVIDLVAVPSEYSGKHVGSDLVRSAIRWFAPRVKSIYVGTQAANSRAIRLYEKLQFRHVCSDATFHLWRELQTYGPFQ